MSAGLPVSYQPAGPITARLTRAIRPTDPAWTPIRASHVRPVPKNCTGWSCTGRTTEISEGRRAA